MEGFSIYNEAIVFSSSTTEYLLQYYVVMEVNRITGEVNGETVEFVADTDYRIDERMVTWLENGTWPDDLSTFYVTYRFQPTLLALVQAVYDRIRLTYPEALGESGSVLRTLINAVMSSVEDLYLFISVMQDYSYIETASSGHLDKCVALLGVVRNDPVYATGEVIFSRDEITTADILIPTGTIVSTTASAAAEAKYYSTTEEGIIPIGETASAEIAVQADSPGADWNSGIGTLNQIVTLLPGVEYVSNPALISGGENIESDDDLRIRASTYVQTMGKGTHTAIFNLCKAVSGIRDVTVLDYEDDPAIDPGICNVILVGDTPLDFDSEAFLEAEAAILADENKPAGIRFIIEPATTVGINLAISAVLDLAYGANETTVKNAAATNLFTYVNGGYDSVHNYHPGFSTGDILTVNQVISHVLQVDGIEDITTPFTVVETVMNERHTHTTGDHEYDLDLYANGGANGHGTLWDVTRVFTISGETETEYVDPTDYHVDRATVSQNGTNHTKLTIHFSGGAEPPDGTFYVDYWVTELEDIDPGVTKILSVTGVEFT